MAVVIAATDGRLAASRAIVGSGTPESAWQAWPELESMPLIAFDALLPRGTRLVVVSPHPDDEVLACGGLLAIAAERDRPILVVSVTDGDASHPGSLAWPPARLAQQRHEEGLEGLRRLGCEVSPMRCGVPDGQVAANAARLATQLKSMLLPNDVVVTTWRYDGHPDHEATAEAVAEACASVVCRLLQVPVWMWHWASPGDPRVPWSRLHRLPLGDDVARRKVDAIEAHHTQLVGQDTGAAPVLPTSALARLLRPFEYFLIEG